MLFKFSVNQSQPIKGINLCRFFCCPLLFDLLGFSLPFYFLHSIDFNVGQALRRKPTPNKDKRQALSAVVSALLPQWTSLVAQSTCRLLCRDSRCFIEQSPVACRPVDSSPHLGVASSNSTVSRLISLKLLFCPSGHRLTSLVALGKQALPAYCCRGSFSEICLAFGVTFAVVGLVIVGMNFGSLITSLYCLLCF
uniref:Uncharacterized protein n=1 Tax=Kalanchoe fedtschenkoi TaxID=63787 RepID=A0A7N0T0V6_KALFE